jgi:hypothetical protein
VAGVLLVGSFPDRSIEVAAERQPAIPHFVDPRARCGLVSPAWFNTLLRRASASFEELATVFRRLVDYVSERRAGHVPLGIQRPRHPGRPRAHFIRPRPSRSPGAALHAFPPTPVSIKNSSKFPRDAFMGCCRERHV